MRYEILRYDEKTTRYKVVEIEGAYVRIREGIKGDKTSIKEFVLKLSPEEMITLAEVLKQNALVELQKKAEQKQQRKQSSVASTSDQNKKIVKIEMLVDIPQFVGEDGNIHGPYKKGKIVEIDPKEAKLLVEKNLAKYVENVETLEHLV